MAAYSVDTIAPLAHRDPEDRARAEETRRRRRMLDGRWADDLAQYLRGVLHATRVDNIGRLSQAVNLYKSTVDQVACLYDSAPTVTHATEDISEFHDLLTDMSVWQLAQKHAGYVYGLRESAYKIDFSEAAGQPRLSLVTPDCLSVDCDPDDADRILVLRHARVRRAASDGKPAYFYDVYDISAEHDPKFYIESIDGTDVTKDYVEVGGYPWVDDEGPFIPLVMFHAAPSGQPWDYSALTELVDAAFDVGVLWNSYHHVMRDASWAQKYGLNVRLMNPTSVREGRAEVVTAPTSLLLFEGEGSLGVLQPAVNPNEFAAAVLTYQRTAVSSMGLHPADLESTAAESGVAITLKRSAQRRMSARLEPQFRRGDAELLSKIARISNLYGTTTYPTDGYRITYAPPAEGVGELDEAFEYDRKLVENGLMSKSTWYCRVHPGSTEGEALQALVEIARETSALRALEEPEEPEETETETPGDENG